MHRMLFGSAGLNFEQSMDCMLAFLAKLGPNDMQTSALDIGEKTAYEPFIDALWSAIQASNNVSVNWLKADVLHAKMEVSLGKTGKVEEEHLVQWMELPRNWNPFIKCR